MPSFQNAEPAPSLTPTELTDCAWAIRSCFTKIIAKQWTEKELTKREHQNNCEFPHARRRLLDLQSNILELEKPGRVANAVAETE